MKAYIVWNESKTEGFVTTDRQLAYEARKGAESNCSDENGRRSLVAVEFANYWINDNCTIEEIEVLK